MMYGYLRLFDGEWYLIPENRIEDFDFLINEAHESCDCFYDVLQSIQKYDIFKCNIFEVKCLLK